MRITITAVRLEGADSNEAITEYQWVEDGTGKSAKTRKPQMVEWIDGGGKAFVADGSGSVPVYTVHPTDGRAPWCQTMSDGKWSNNLLSLPRY